MRTMFLPAISGRAADLERRGDRGAGRNADRDAFDAGAQARVVEGVVVADRDDLVDRRAVEDRRHEAGADALDLVRAGLAAGQDRAVGRLDRDDLEAGLARLQHLADAGDGAAGADAGDEDVDLAVGVVPDFLGRGPAVDRRVGRVLELLRDDGVRDLLRPAPRRGRWRPSCPWRPRSAPVRRRAAPASCAARSTSISGMTRISR